MGTQLPPKGAQPSPNFRPCPLWSVKMPLGTEVFLGSGDIALDGDPASPPNGQNPQVSAHVCCGQTAGWMKMQLVTEGGLGPGDTVLDGGQLPPRKGAPHSGPHFWVHVYCGQTVADLSNCGALVCV